MNDQEPTYDERIDYGCSLLAQAGDGLPDDVELAD